MDTRTYTAMITACAHNDLLPLVIEAFEEMRQRNVPRNRITFVGSCALAAHSGGILFFTPFVAEAPHNILLYVVVCCTKGVVRLTYE